MPEYANLVPSFEYAGICMNMPKSARMGFVLHIPNVTP